MRHALILVLACGLASCTLTSPKSDAMRALGGGGITETTLAAPGAAVAGGGTDAPAQADAASAAASTAAPDAVKTPTATAPAGSGDAATQASALAVPALTNLGSGAAPKGATAPIAQVATKNTPHPRPRPTSPPDAASPDTAAAASAPPPKPRSTPQILCEASGGVWGQAEGSGPFFCQKKTRDGGKSCHRKSDCEGECLGPSGTCAPVTPLAGCNKVLDEQGRLMTLCLN